VRIDTGELVSRAAAGESAAWDALVDQYSSLLWSIARGFRLSTADSADAIQTTWLRLVENLDRIEDPERLPGWLATTVRRECLRVLRQSKREQVSASDDGLPEIVDPAEPLDAHLLREERDAELWRTFEQLGDRCRTLLRVLMATPPPSYAEVSAALDMPVGSIGPTRQRCLDHLRRLTEGPDVLGDPRTGRGE
jgi:RNA polymerase sigma factor (sigma-70 family)